MPNKVKPITHRAIPGKPEGSLYAVDSENEAQRIH